MKGEAGGDQVVKRGGNAGPSLDKKFKNHKRHCVVTAYPHKHIHCSKTKHLHSTGFKKTRLYKSLFYGSSADRLSIGLHGFNVLIILLVFLLL